MTCIAWDGHTLAADKLASMGTIKYTTVKIFRGRDNSLIGYAGNSDFGEQMLAWWEAGADPEKFPPSQRSESDWAGLIVIRKGHPIWRYERTPHPIKFYDRQFAIGCGREFALATMHPGHDARKAVEVACALDSGCGMGIDTLTLAE